MLWSPCQRLHRRQVHAVRLRRDRIVVALEHKVGRNAETQALSFRRSRVITASTAVSSGGEVDMTALRIAGARLQLCGLTAAALH